MNTPRHPRNLLELFDCGYWWRNRGGEWVTVGAMTPEHRYNTARWLERNAPAYQMRYEIALMHSAFDLPDEIDWFIDDPQTWVRRTALFKALEAGLPQRGRLRRRLAERAKHWTQCPMRLRRKDRPAVAACCCTELTAVDRATFPTPRESEIN